MKFVGYVLIVCCFHSVVCLAQSEVWEAHKTVAMVPSPQNGTWFLDAYARVTGEDINQIPLPGGFPLNLDDPFTVPLNNVRADNGSSIADATAAVTVIEDGSGNDLAGSLDISGMAIVGDGAQGDVAISTGESTAQLVAETSIPIWDGTVLKGAIDQDPASNSAYQAGIVIDPIWYVNKANPTQRELAFSAFLRGSGEVAFNHQESRLSFANSNTATGRFVMQLGAIAADGADGASRLQVDFTDGAVDDVQGFGVFSNFAACRAVALESGSVGGIVNEPLILEGDCDPDPRPLNLTSLFSTKTPTSDYTGELTIEVETYAYHRAVGVDVSSYNDFSGSNPGVTRPENLFSGAAYHHEVGSRVVLVPDPDSHAFSGYLESELAQNDDVILLFDRRLKTDTIPIEKITAEIDIRNEVKTKLAFGLARTATYGEAGQANAGSRLNPFTPQVEGDLDGLAVEIDVQGATAKLLYNSKEVVSKELKSDILALLANNSWSQLELSTTNRSGSAIVDVTVKAKGMRAQAIFSEVRIVDASFSDDDRLFVAGKHLGSNSVDFDLNEVRVSRQRFLDSDWNGILNEIGDFDNSGVVDFSDFLVLSENFGTKVSPPGANGDVSGDGSVEFGDFLVLSENFGKSVDDLVQVNVGRQVASVPEPASFPGFACGMVVLLIGLGRNSRRHLTKTRNAGRRNTIHATVGGCRGGKSRRETGI